MNQPITNAILHHTFCYLRPQQLPSMVDGFAVSLTGTDKKVIKNCSLDLGWCLSQTAGHFFIM